MLRTMSGSFVCGTDLSPGSQRAADGAVAVARALGARLVLVHVTRASPGPLRDDAERRTRGEADRLAALLGAPVAAEVRDGQAPEQLARAAAAAHASLTVVGATGEARSMLRLGGTAERVVRASVTPVLVVRDPAPLARWAAHGGLRIGALATADAASLRAAGWVRLLRRAAPADVTFLHGYYPDVAAWHFGLPMVSAVEHDRRLEALVEQELRDAIGPVDGAGAVGFRAVLGVGRLADPLLSAAEELGCELLVVGHHRRGPVARLASIASGVLHLAEASVLVVPAEAPPAVPAPPPRLRRVLVPTDFSPAAAAALPHAYGLAGPVGAQVVLLHVLPRTADQLELAGALARLRELVPLDAPAGVATESEVVVGDEPADAITDAAARLGADYVVLSSHGRAGLRRLLLGSVAEAVMRRSTRPVLVVRPPPDA